jgi:hypothetical protein
MITAGHAAHAYEIRPRKDHRGVDLISEALPFGGLWYGEPNAVSNAIRYAKFYSRSHDAVIRVYDAAGNVIELLRRRTRGRSGVNGKKRTWCGQCSGWSGSSSKRSRWCPRHSDMMQSKQSPQPTAGRCATSAFQLHKRRQLFIRTHNETLPVAAMRVSNPDCSPAGINR